MLTVFPAPGAAASGALRAPEAAADHPVYWFVVMEDAKDRGDFETAARAKRELERLGVFIRYTRRPPRKGGDHVA
ncbi:MAG TPA: hypothetical protein VKA46_00185 [Gemmataceae bacterium]|nr:hypothetical protein [Gemmataceae bacterium]